QRKPFTDSSPTASSIFCCISPVGAISQTSRSPNRLSLVPKTIEESVGETDHPTALSRSFRGALPRAETIQIVVFLEPETLGSIPDKCELAMNRELSGNQPLGTISQSKSLFLNPSGLGTTRVSPVAMSLTYIPLLSAYARYFPSGEIAPLVTGFSKELTVSCFNLTSGRD